MLLLKHTSFSQLEDSRHELARANFSLVTFTESCVRVKHNQLSSYLQFNDRPNKNPKQ